ncbi:MAG: D-glycero-D-manno-heptose 1-phosphate guanosyltransferase [Candidatus Ozemobacter sibiricus]|uniref:D-glycero-D-manno-heptose 1-phosphate guanosyltransferase n=1 Tax=Candidatus Ozemobacter sibiricus TaxID=2268124 RepID=A0A367ZJS8_9BACT|nr:MAG: D-glycero-D-manno-heptose 1-phosphate guanosyltransferase [Candidatus Ozemobacter sibiricus]
MNRRLEQVLLPPETTILDTLRAIDAAALEIALIVDADRHLLGTVTDGDIRRGILRGVTLDSRIDQLMNPRPLTARPDTPDDELLFLMSRRSIKHVPIVDGQGRVIHLRRLQDLVARAPRPHQAVIMAGGLGRRLGALTRDTPKPLLPVGGRPILETIVRQLRRHGIVKIFLSVNYHADQIKAHFQNLRDLDAEIAFLEEKEFLGTAGSLSLLPEKPATSLIVMNGDILCPVNISNLLDYHAAAGRALTLCTREFTFQIPYGVIVRQGAELIDIEEKPEQKILINAGIYVLEPRLLELIPPATRLDMPDLIRQVARGHGGVACYPLSEFWLDIGQPADYQEACARISGVFAPGDQI